MSLLHHKRDNHAGASLRAAANTASGEGKPRAYLKGRTTLIMTRKTRCFSEGRNQHFIRGETTRATLEGSDHTATEKGQPGVT